MRFDINNYKGKYAMHCKTEQEAREFCDYLHSIGKKWCNRKSYQDDTEWISCTINTCYDFNKGERYYKSYYIRHDYTILEWSDFTTEFTKADLKDGMVVEYTNGWRRMVLGQNLIGDKLYVPLCTYTDDLREEHEPVYTINKVYKSHACFLGEIREDDFLTLIWERKEEKPEPEEMTLAEVCKALGKEIKIVKE